MSEALEQLLRLVAEGKLTPDEAAPLVAVLSERPGSAGSTAGPQGLQGGQGRQGAQGPQGAQGAQGAQPSDAPGMATSVPRHVHIEVRDHGRQAVNLRVPLALGHAAVRMVPGLASDYVQRVREALEAGLAGPIVDVIDDDGDGVRISLD